jgi:hypothetical protein
MVILMIVSTIYVIGVFAMLIIGSSFILPLWAISHICNNHVRIAGQINQIYAGY